MNSLIAGTFTDSLARLTGDEQKAFGTTAIDLLMDRPGQSPARGVTRRPALAARHRSTRKSGTAPPAGKRRASYRLPNSRQGDPMRVRDQVTSQALLA
jgi:hypothetical protein